MRILAPGDSDMLNSIEVERSRVSRVMQHDRFISLRSKIAAVLIVFALLSFTTVRTSSIVAGIGPGSSLSKTTPKQRQLSVTEISWIAPVVSQLAVVPLDCGDVAPAEFHRLPPRRFFGRYFNLPPPTA